MQTTSHPHTLGSIAESRGCKKRAAQSWHSQARRDHGELGRLILGVRHFSSDEREIILSYAGPQRSSQACAGAPVVATEIVPSTYADPFAGVEAGGAIVPIDYQATDRSAAVATLTGQISDLCQVSAVNTQNLTHQLLVNGQNLGDQLGAALGAQIIQSAESRKNAMVGEYLRSQGVTAAPKSSAAA